MRLIILSVVSMVRRCTVCLQANVSLDPPVSMIIVYASPHHHPFTCPLKMLPSVSSSSIQGMSEVAWAVSQYTNTVSVTVSPARPGMC